MSFKIKKAAVLGAGVMGAGIAAHLTNAGIECYLLDIIPFELTEDDKKKGLTEKSPAWRNRFAANGLAAVTKSKPASFYSKKNASMVKIGNFEDNLKWLADVDWICEVVVENLKIKQELFAKVEKVVKPTCIVSTNTSGIPIKDISAKFGPALKKRFLGTHFFNPPRYMKLMEIIPGEETDKEVVDFMKWTPLSARPSAIRARPFSAPWISSASMWDTTLPKTCMTPFPMMKPAIRSRPSLSWIK